jgi:hypothetical protein
LRACRKDTFQVQERIVALADDGLLFGQAQAEGFEPADAGGEMLKGGGQLLLRGAETGGE